MSAEGPRFTLDTNLLVYSVDNAAGERHRVALEIVDRAIESECWLTLQALGEFYVAATRKGMPLQPPSVLRSPMPRRDAFLIGMHCS